jgi:hypothetical protein
MLKSRNLMMLVTLLVFLAAVPTIALANGSAKFTIPNTLFIAGNEVKPGEYDIKWESSSPEATVTFITKEKVVAKAQGKIVEGDKRFDFDTFLIGKDSAGRMTIKELQFSGKKFRIVFE